MKRLKIAVGFLLFRPVINLMFFLLVKVHRFNRTTIGQVVLWGDEHFLELTTKALEHLHTLDEGLYEKITTGRRMRFYSSRKPSEQLTDLGLFNINDGICEMGVQGVVARIVYAYFVSEAMGSQYFSKAERHHAHKLHNEAKGQTRSWLEAKDFSEAVIAIF